MKPLKKQVQLFLVSDDEREISVALRAIRPSVRFVDDNVWDEATPTLAPSIDACRSRLVYLWDQSIVPELPAMKRKDGRFEGPVAGVVVQYIRAQLQGDVLLSGRVAAGIGGMDDALESAMSRFVADVWKVVTEATPGRLDAIEPGSGRVLHSGVREYRAGRHAVMWLAQESERLLKDRSTASFYRPAS
jgi:hypothetical protein